MSVTSMSRRNSSRIYQDLKAAGISSLSLFDQSVVESLDEAATDAQPGTGARKMHVGVVGAGISGLRCADVLLRNGCDVTILEARDRLGGRVHQAKLPSGHSVDMGPNWIHGTEDNPICWMARETNTVTGSWDNNPYVLDQNATLLSLEETATCSTLMWDIIEEAFQFSNKFCADIDPNKTLWDFYQEKVIERIPDTLGDHEKLRKIVLQMAELWGAFVGSPVTRQSLKYFWLEECLDGGMWLYRWLT